MRSCCGRETGAVSGCEMAISVLQGRQLRICGHHTINPFIMTDPNPDLVAALLPLEILKKLVEEADLAAVENVREGRGGPFGASLNIINLENNWVMRIGEIAGNAVLETGIGSAHAEDQALSPENVRALSNYRLDRRARGINEGHQQYRTPMLRDHGIRKIPGRDRGHDTDGLFDHDDAAVRGGSGDDVAINALGFLGEPLDES